MGTNPSYSDEYLLDKLETHLVNEMKSKYTLHTPTWQCYLKRMDKDPDFAIKVNNCVAKGEEVWEELGISAAKGEGTVNTGMYKTMTCNKKFALAFETIELEERLKVLEDARDA